VDLGECRGWALSPRHRGSIRQVERRRGTELVEIGAAQAPASHGGMKARVRVGGERGRAEASCQALVRRDRRQTREREQEESRRDTKRKKRAGGTQRF
jgi:hypothetical protein